MSTLESLLYVSVARPGLSDADFDALLASARRNNARHGLTGVLLKYGERFVQVIEGPGWSVDECLTTIRADPRHTDLRIVQRAPLAERRFAGWSMRKVRLAFGADRVAEAFLGALYANAPDSATAERAIALLVGLAQRAAAATPGDGD
jgi:Sensors of blue-light using FAD